MNSLYSFSVKRSSYFSITLLISLIIIIPVITVFLSIFDESSEYFSIIKNSLLFIYCLNSLILLCGVAILTFIFGVFSAYLVSFYSFPGSNFFKWSLILSFAIPPYIYGYSLTAFVENFGTVSSIMFYFLNENNFDRYIPKLNGMIGSIISISFSVFGYVYILTRSSFIYQSQNLIEVGQSLGFSKLKIFLYIVLPSARPAIVAGMSLVAMETLSDFGTVSFFGVSTFTTAIYESWVDFDDLGGANKLASILLIFIFFLFLTEQISRKNARYNYNSEKFVEKNFKKLKGSKAFLAFTFCSILFTLSFIFPLGQMLYWSIKFPEYYESLELFKLNVNTFILIFFSSVLLIVFAFFVNYSLRSTQSKFLSILSNLTISGYAIPGIILSIALISFFSSISQLINLNLKSVFLGSIYGLVFAYFIRFFSVAFSGIKTSYLKINNAIDESSYLLGYSKFQTLSQIHLPYLKNSVFLISILIGIEILKELPITLILRPFNFETFSTKAYAYASQDLLEAAAIPSLFLILWASLLIFIAHKFFFSEK